MNEREALAAIAADLPSAGDDCAVVGDRVLTTDMLHETTDFPDGVTRYTAGWRAVGASLSDVAAMGADAEAAVAVYAAPEFDPDALRGFIRGAREVCEAVDGEYVGGDLDDHDEFTVSTTALGATADPVLRSGASPGEAVCVTGSLGRTAAALRWFDRGDAERGNELFRFTPRVGAGVALRPYATAMMDSSDGLARSLHQLSEASDCGFAVESDSLPVDEAVRETSDGGREARERALFVGEDFELVFTLPESALDAAREASPTPLARVGTTTDDGVELDGDPLADRGYGH
ncbi:thiamine-phosphate kinase [Candidatus Halobonum tyrrellensis]|uniref:Thiamine-monophosphate kinase n=1 Tax=Candidatus Halobonum tyrrellensis G22 TaxID=1324957 RepID=V4GQM7_9EURY|nr:thiamine-phosphate kinase [Candidatus Halobonum tyrrellensis]ESP87331.1 thiamine-monophosphate kinase [Candidatus Halobonum tyrrellensis G22]